MRSKNITLALFLIAMSLASCGLPGDIPHKSDVEMIENFKNNREGFELLLKMIKEDEKKVGDQMFRIDDDWTNPKNLEEFGISKNQIAKYRKTFYELGIPRGFYAWNNDFYLLISSTQGLAVSGTSKSYAWGIDIPQNLIVDSIDEYIKDMEKKEKRFPVYQHIEGKWYLQFATD